MDCLWYYVESFTSSVLLPKLVSIKNRRLGVFNRFLQLSCIGLLLLYAFSVRAWLGNFDPVDRGISMWMTMGDDQPLKEHCSNIADYEYVYSSNFAYRPEKCIDLSLGEAALRHGDEFFVLTHLSDTYYDKAKPGPDCTTLQADCAAKGGTFKSSTCECERSIDMLVKQPEEGILHFIHGYEVRLPDRIIQGRVTTQAIEKKLDLLHGKSLPWQEIPGNEGRILTMIQRSDGTPCKVGKNQPGGAKSTWIAGDVTENGVEGSIEEWLACGDIGLDEHRPELSSGAAGEYGKIRPRMAGMTVQLHLTYYNNYHMLFGRQDACPDCGVVCYVRVVTLPQWNSRRMMAYSQVPDPDTGAGSYRFRYSYGISLEIRAKGSFAYFDVKGLITNIVNMIVLLQFPQQCIMVVALFGIGLTSQVYYRAAIEEVDIRTASSGLVARTMVGAEFFKDASGKKNSECTLVSKKKLDDKLREMLKEYMVLGGPIDEFEFKALRDEIAETLQNSVEPGASVNARKSVSGDQSDVALGEWIEVFTRNEYMKVDELVQMYDVDRSRSCLERLLADSHLRAFFSNTRKRRKQVHPLEASNSFEDDVSSSPDKTTLEKEPPILWS